MKHKILGDFQTPLPLAQQIVTLLQRDGMYWSRVIEPTCGKGHFIEALVRSKMPPQEIIGIEIQPEYVQQARQIDANTSRISIEQGNIFEIDVCQDLTWHTNGSLLIVGNPPWVTNSDQGILGGDNLPLKENFKNFSGLDALTGKSNFDIAEYIWLKLLHQLRGERATIAFLVKTSIARNVLQYAHKNKIAVSGAQMYRIDAKRWFNAAVDACLFILHLNTDAPNYEAEVYNSLWDDESAESITVNGSALVSNLRDFQDIQYINGLSPVEWRQGIKHDAASVMELMSKEAEWINKTGEIVDIEDSYIYPLIKSSEVKPSINNAHLNIHRGVIVPQTSVGQNTQQLAKIAPRLWEYLNRHRAIFEARKSSIYHNKQPFSIFGIGDYSFARYKVVVSGFYKTPTFYVIEPVNNKPVLCDDTCYLVPFDHALDAYLVAALLNHASTQRFIQSLTFQGAKRPITKTLLMRIDLRALVLRLTEQDICSIICQLPEAISNAASDLPQTSQNMADYLFPEQKRLF